MTESELNLLKPELQKMLIYFKRKPVFIIPSNVTELMTNGYNLSILLDWKMNQGLNLNN